ncbi:MAG: hypothetical protein LBI35_01095 [Burkholderiales bacterium]|jgi:uncharacterized protein YeeX (DUF496 family)|nr:hypothetical protein [Burkholderiales bacterium]
MSKDFTLEVKNDVTVSVATEKRVLTDNNSRFSVLSNTQEEIDRGEAYDEIVLALSSSRFSVYISLSEIDVCILLKKLAVTLLRRKNGLIHDGDRVEVIFRDNPDEEAQKPIVSPRLRDAAPELLAALKMMVREFEYQVPAVDLDGHSALLSIARAALTKATGKKDA